MPPDVPEFAPNRVNNYLCYLFKICILHVTQSSYHTHCSNIVSDILSSVEQNFRYGTLTHNDNAFNLNKACQIMASLLTKHWVIVKQTLRYVIEKESTLASFCFPLMACTSYVFVYIVIVIERVMLIL